jgi:hypothetical protein
LKNALTRDYTNLMKAIDKKKVNWWQVLES